MAETVSYQRYPNRCHKGDFKLLMQVTHGRLHNELCPAVHAEVVQSKHVSGYKYTPHMGLSHTDPMPMVHLQTHLCSPPAGSSVAE